MFSRVNGVGWMEGEGEEGDSVSWNRDVDKADELSLSTFKSMLDDDWNGCYLNPSNPNPPSHDSSPHTAAFQMLKDIPFPPPSNPPSSQDTLLLQPVESSSSCSPSSIFALDPSRAQSFATPKNCLSSLLNVVCNNPFEAGFDLGFEAAMFPPLPASMQSNSAVSMNRGGGVLSGFNGLGSNGQVSVNDFGQKGRFSAALLLPLQENSGFNLGIPSFDGFSGNLGNPLFANRPKVLRPLEVSPPVGAQPTLFQKRAALRQNSASAAAEKAGNSRVLRSEGIGVPIMPQVAVRKEVEEEARKQRKCKEMNEIDEASVDVSGLNYDSDEGEAETANKGEESGKNGAMGGDQKGKKKGLPAKNLMAERRRRKKLNDRLYMLRSVVPKISKMDRASILGDAIEYLKELLQRINDLHNELESTPSGSSLPSNVNFHPLTPTLPTLPCRVKEELCLSSLPSPNNQTAKVEVRVREGRAVNIHMFCARKPGLLLSTMRALDSLGLDIQQAVISCFNGFALDVFRAEMDAKEKYGQKKLLIQFQWCSICYDTECLVIKVHHDAKNMPWLEARDALGQFQQCKEGPDMLPDEIKEVLEHSAGFHSAM